VAGPDTMTPWVLLRGLTREARHWGRFPEALRGAIPGSRVLTPDLAGFGARAGVRSPTRVEAIVEALREDLREAAASPPYRLLALSLGGMVAVDWARRHPSEVSACVLVNASLGAFSPFHRRLLPRNYATLLAIAWPGTPDSRKEALIHAMTSNRPDTDGEIVRTWARYRTESPPRGGQAIRQLLAAARYRGDGGPPPVPVLLLAGAGDRLVDPACSRAIARGWNVPLREHPTAGHDLPLDAGDWVAEQVRRWRDER